MTISPTITYQPSIIRYQTLETDLLKLYGDRYDYSEFIYKGMDTKSTIICKVCSTSKEVTMGNLLKGINTCPTCVLNERHDNMIKENSEKYQGGFDILSRYISFDDDIDVRCNKCYLEFSTSVRRHLLGGCCPNCKPISERWTHDKFSKALDAKHNYKFTVLSEFKTITEKINVRCNDCKLEFKVIPNGLLKSKVGRGCKVCFEQKRTKTHEQFLVDIKEVHGDKYTILGIYVQNKQNLDVLCNACSTVWSGRPNALLNGAGCRVCYKTSQKHTNEWFIEKITEKFKGNIAPLEPYITLSDKVKVQCQCGEIFSTTPNILLRDRSINGCYVCGKVSQRKTNEKFLLDLKELHGDRYTPLNEYTTQRTKMEFICNECNKTFTDTPMRIFGGCGCRCISSGGFNPNIKGYLYYIKVVRGEVVTYKIGITNRTVKQRFGQDMQYITTISVIEYEIGRDAHSEEQRILREYKEFKYYGEPLLKAGNSELFYKDILGLDINSNNII